MKQILLSIAVIIMLASCGEDTSPMSTKKVRTLELYFSEVTFRQERLPGVEVRYVDTMYHTGDTVWLRDAYHVILP